MDIDRCAYIRTNEKSISSSNLKAYAIQQSKHFKNWKPWSCQLRSFNYFHKSDSVLDMKHLSFCFNLILLLLLYYFYILFVFVERKINEVTIATTASASSSKRCDINMFRWKMSGALKWKIGKSVQFYFVVWPLLIV